MNQSRRDFLYKAWILICSGISWNSYGISASKNTWYSSSWWWENIQTQSVNPSQNSPIYITIDDGPSRHTLKMADELEKYWHRWIFFLIGKNISRYKKDVLEILNRWHQIGNHSYSHALYSKLWFEEIKKETLQTDAIMNELISQSQQDSKQKKLFRYPFWWKVASKFQKDFEELLQKANYHNESVLWHNDTNDWKNETSISDIYQRVIATQVNKIVLMHEKEKTLHAMKTFSRELASMKKIWVTKLI